MSPHGVSSRESRDPIGYAVAAMNRLAQSDMLDRLGLRRQTEKAVLAVTRTGFRTATTAGRAFARAGQRGRAGTRPDAATPRGVFDLTPTEDEQMLVDVVTELATEVVRPAAAGADAVCATPDEVLKAGNEVGLPILGVPESLGGLSGERTAVAGALVAEALAKGDLGIAVAALAPGSVATAISLWGTDEQQATYLPAFTGDQPPAAAIALNEPTVLFDVLEPATTATRTSRGFVLDGVKSLVPRGADAELLVIGARIEGGGNALFLLEAGAPGLRVESDPAMGVRAASLTRLVLVGVEVPDDALLGGVDGVDVVDGVDGADGTTYAGIYAQCVRLSRLAWCALAVGTAQAVVDHVVPYVKEREAFGEPVAYRQSVAFLVADMAIELQAMRLLTYKAAARVAAGKDASREIGLARHLCASKGMKIGLDGVQLLGGHGFVKEHPVERWYRDLRAIGVMEGGVLV